MDAKDLEIRFSHHAPDRDRAATHGIVREQLLHVAKVLNRHLPEGREKSLVFTKLEEACFWANAAIAREPAQRALFLERQPQGPQVAGTAEPLPSSEGP